MRALSTFDYWARKHRISEFRLLGERDRQRNRAYALKLVKNVYLEGNILFLGGFSWPHGGVRIEGWLLTSPKMAHVSFNTDGMK